MRAWGLAFLVFFGVLSGSTVTHAAILDSQTDSSTNATLPSSNQVFLALGYVPTQSLTVSGVRFRINASASSTNMCPSDVSVFRYFGTTTPPSASDAGSVAGILYNATSTSPDTYGNCDYIALNKFQNGPLTFDPNYYYVFLLNPGWSSHTWVSINGSSYTGASPSRFGFRIATYNFYEWGTTGLDAPFFEFFDNAPTSDEPPTPPPTPDPCATPGACASNVLFLPGIEASRLYEGTGCDGSGEEKLWEPIGESIIRILRGAGDDKVRKLYLDAAGKSLCTDIYAKESDILDSVRSNAIYGSFITQMNSLKTADTINDWKAAAYDWRLSLSDLLSNGTLRDGKIFYTEATSSPYIEQTLRSLAATSKTGKVTIIAHSNGGLVTKALLKKLGNTVTESLVDKIIFVGVPQSGAPAAVGALLYGYDQGISSHGIPILHSDVAQGLAQNSPMAYRLLPSEQYFANLHDGNHPVGRFSGDGYAYEQWAYGPTLDSAGELDDFASTTFNPDLIAYTNDEHYALDTWTPPSQIEVDQIAGWGVDTVAGVDFYTLPPINALTATQPIRAYRPIFTEDGDGTVPIPSALLMASSTNMHRYWVDLSTYFKDTKIKRTHRDILEVPSIGDFIINTIQNNTHEVTYISTAQPLPNTQNKKLIFFLHSPLTLLITDSSGSTTGLSIDGSIDQNITDSVYGEFGDVKYVSVPEGQYSLSMQGQDSGTFSLDMEEVIAGVITASTTIANVPVTSHTLVSLSISSGLENVSALSVDTNGDGVNDISLIPQIGAIVPYTAPVVRELQTTVTPVFGGSIALPPISSSSLENATDTLIALVASTTQVVTSNKVGMKAGIKPHPYPQKLHLLPQTASIYTASQQPVLNGIEKAVYTKLHNFWTALKRFFNEI